MVVYHWFLLCPVVRRNSSSAHLRQEWPTGSIAGASPATPKDFRNLSLSSLHDTLQQLRIIDIESSFN